MRLFEEHILRKVQDLSGVWKFRTDEKDEGEALGYPKGFSDGDKIVVPSVWNNEKGLLSYEGAGWYEKKFYTDGGTLRFWFGGVMTQADIWLDGEKLGEHYGGFCEFSFIKRGVSEGWHTLVVRADNRFDADSIPQKIVDWWHCGGIIREITVEKLVDICALYTKTDYDLNLEKKRAQVTQRVELYNASNTQIKDKVTLLFEGRVFEQEVCLQGGEEKTIEFSFEEENIKLWDTDSPNLYMVTLRTATDDLCSRVGFRKVEVKPDGVYLNGVLREICGVNRHEEHPEWGFAFPPRLMKRDIDIALDMGCNSIRGSHYPNSHTFVDYCDEMGILFWSEIPIWGSGFTAAAIAREKVVERGLEMHKEMVRYYFDHPSIIMWGMHNEIPTDAQAAFTMSELYYTYLKENGGNRIVTYATDKPLIDICLEFCDVICINQYKGWYGGEISSWEPFMEEFRQRRTQLGFEQKPVILSEFGAAAVYGHSTFDDERWTEEYQARLIGHCLNLFHNDPMVCGAYIWQFADARSASDINRARRFNNKGILNEYRKPKLAYYAARESYKKFQEEKKND